MFIKSKTKPIVINMERSDCVIYLLGFTKLLGLTAPLVAGADKGFEKREFRVNVNS